MECTGDVPAMTNLAWTDNCDGTASVIGTDVSDGNSCPEVITRTWTYTDVCGNTTDVTQTITIHDITPPTASNPATTTVPGGPVPAVDITVVIDEADNCGIPTVAFVSESTDGAACPEEITRIYSVTDACGNTINVTHTILITDPFPPTASNPTPINVECIVDVPAVDITVVTDEADNQGTPVVAWESDVSDGNSCPEVITRTYSVTDACGGVIYVTQTITINDITAPIFAAAPANITVECIGDVPVMTNLAYTDNCDVAGNVVGTDVSDNGSCPEVITRTWTYTDACGNTTNASQTITIDDTQNPTASNLAPVSYQCIGDLVAANILDVIDEADNCTANPVVAFVSDVSDNGSCPEVITRTYSVTDDCNNTTNVTQTITINDTQNPTASNPIAENVQCSSDIPATDINVVTDEADNCGVPTVAWVSDVSDNGTCPEVITRTYSVTDDCNNTINVTQTITINDTQNPTASNPVAENVQCSVDVPATDINVVTDETDNCSVPTVAWVSDVSDNGTCPEVITRTYSVTDDCNNTINVTQTIIINDTQNPTASNLAGINVQCIGDVVAANVLDVTDEADNCGVPTVAWVSDVSDGNTCPEIITRMYSVTDACGNSIDVTQIITINDTQAPQIVGAISVTNLVGLSSSLAPPAATSVSGIENLLGNSSISDNCISDANLIVSSVDIETNSCPIEITRTYTVTDACGNFNTIIHIINIDNIVDPTFNAIAAICAGDNLSALPTTSNNGIVGSWSPAINNTATTLYAFTPSAGECANSTTLIIVVNPLPTPSITGTNFCEGGTTILSASSGYLSYLWNTSVSNQTITIADGGSYYVTVTDNNTCQATASINITEYVNPTPNIVGNTVFCEGELTNISVGSYNNYNWSTSEHTQSISISNQGNYSITVTDNNGCTGTDQVNIVVNPIPVVFISGDLEICEGQVSVLEAIGTFSSYQWSNASATYMTSVNATGTYSVTVTNEHACTASTSFGVTVHPNPTPTITGDLFFCSGTATHIDAGTYSSYIWSNGSSSQALNITNPGAYAVTVTDEHACIGSTSVNVDTDTVAINISADQLICYGSSTTIGVQIVSGIGPFTYQWSSGANTPTLTINPLATANYYVTVIDAYGCVSNIDMTTISVTDQVNLEVSASVDSVCPNTMVEINGAVTDGVQPYTLTDSYGNVITDFNDVLVHNSTTLIYSVVDQCGSWDKDTIEIGVYPTPDVNFTANVNSGCEPLSVQFIESNFYSNDYEYLWIFGDGGINSSNQNTTSYTYNSNGTYDVSLTVIDQNGCESSHQINEYINVYAIPEADFNTNPKEVDFLNANIDFQNLSLGNDYNFWNFGDNTTSSTENPTHYYNNIGYYDIQLVVVTEEGCVDSVSHRIRVTDIFTFYAPDAFSPGYDGVNDYFFPFAHGIDEFKEYDFEIYDRWGMVIYKSNIAADGTDKKYKDYDPLSVVVEERGWNGRHNNSEEFVQNGIYTWRVRLTDFNGVAHEYTGKVTVIR